MLLFGSRHPSAVERAKKGPVQVSVLCYQTTDSLTPSLGVLGLHVLVRWFDRLQTYPKG
jgi:hypothetical protein